MVEGPAQRTLIPAFEKLANVRFRPVADIKLDVLCEGSIHLGMRYDLDILNEFCSEIGLNALMTDNSSLEVSLGDETVLCFQNSELDEDCLMGFANTPWHTHGDLMFSDHHGHFVELDPLNLLSGLCSGDVLICEQEVSGALVDRWLVHKVYHDEFQHLMPGERLIVRRAG